MPVGYKGTISNTISNSMSNMQFHTCSSDSPIFHIPLHSHSVLKFIPYLYECIQYFTVNNLLTYVHEAECVQNFYTT